MKNFEVGEIVRLKSGGPNMTVDVSTHVKVGVNLQNTGVSCVWFSGDSGPFRDTFLEPLLEKLKNTEE